MSKNNMTNKSAKSAFIASVLSLILCCAMFIGGTYAWFTDTATTGVNKVVSGDLDVVLLDADGNELTDVLTFVNKAGSSDILWEPGARFRTQGFQIKNNGKLWVKYKVQINNTEVSYNKLNSVIDFYLVNGDGEKVDIKTMKDIPLAPSALNEEGTLFIEGKMSEDAGNEYQGLTLEGVSITVYASQYTYESDIEDEKYDDESLYDDEIITVKNADEFIATFNSIKNGDIVTLTDNIDMTNRNWIPVDNKSFTLNGGGYTITGLNGGMADHTGATSIVIKNVTFDGLKDDSSTNYAGLIGDADTCSYIYMENVTVKNADISSAKYAAGFAAYTTGYNNDNDGPVNAMHKFINCTLENSTITGGGSTAGLVAHCGGNAATTTIVENFSLVGENTITGEDNAHTGTVIGTAHIGEIIIKNTSAAENADGIGRFVPGTTGKLTVNGVEKTEFKRV